MKSSTLLKIVLDPVNLGWDLRSTHAPNAVVGVIGWKNTEHAIDAGAPHVIVKLICNVLCRSGQVSFLNPESTIKLSPPPLERLKGRPSFAITTTTQSDTATRLFEITKFPWEQRSQIVILSAADSAPVFDYSSLFELWSEPFPDLNMLAKGMQAYGFMFPGVDGDFAEIVMFDDSVWGRFRELLSDECRLANILIQEVSEDEFCNTEWIEPDGP
ncbi:MAG: hypothetical protein ABFS39_12320 [Pseudomonadota bacterium]